VPEVWKEFFRAPNARVVEEIGTGLGLALVAEAVTRHHGHIDVQSVEGEGTTFRVVLPCAADDVELPPG
jgi:signal transduction histidine kinase